MSSSKEVPQQPSTAGPSRSSGIESRGAGGGTQKTALASAPTVFQFQEWAFESLLNAAKSAACESSLVRSAKRAGRPACARQDGGALEARTLDRTARCHLANEADVEGPLASSGPKTAKQEPEAGHTAERPHHGRLWRVIGGEETGGIVVRRSRGAFSSAESSRLATGAVVEELALEGGRLRYRKLSGAGPESGWVSVSIVPRSTGVARDLLTRLPSQEAPPGGAGAGADGGSTRASSASPLASEAPSVCEDADSTAGANRAEVQEESDGEVDVPVSLWHLLSQNDPVARSLGEGTTQYRGVLCDARDMSLFELLRAELLRIERDKELRAKWQQRGIWSSDGHKLRGHDYVLRRMADLLGVEGLSWASNLYEDAAVACNFHHDGDKYGGGDSHNPGIQANLTMVASFGATRDFTLRHDGTGREFSFTQHNGDVIAFDRRVDDDFMHGLHPADGRGDPRISVVIVGKVGGRATHLWAPRFQSNIPLWLPRGSDRLPRLMQFSGIFAREAPHDFTPEELSFFAARGSRVAIEYHKLLSKRFKTVSGLGL